jgi:hypothetical protein
LLTHPLATAQVTSGRAQNAAAAPAIADVRGEGFAVGRMTGTPCQNVPRAGAGACVAADAPAALTQMTSAATTATREALTPNTESPETA